MVNNFQTFLSTSLPVSEIEAGKLSMIPALNHDDDKKIQTFLVQAYRKVKLKLKNYQ